MLDQLLIAQASLNTLRVLTNVALVSMALLVAGGAGVSLTRGAGSGFRRPVRFLSKIVVGLSALGAAMLVVVVGLAALHGPERFEWTVDLRTELELSVRPLDVQGRARTFAVSLKWHWSED